MNNCNNKKDNPDSDGEADKIPKVIKTAADLQRIKLEKLMKQPDKPVYIPEKRKEKKMVQPPEFIRNAWGSSAGAGSGDFHVYRGVRRREYARQKFLNEKTEKEEKDAEFLSQLEKNKKLAEEKTSKKRAKRLKKKANAKKKRKEKMKSESEESESDEGENNSSEVDNGEQGEIITTTVKSN